MPENIECRDCGQVILGIVATMSPVSGDECPGCGGSEFDRV